MAKYDQGGGCPCGLQKVCDCGFDPEEQKKRPLREARCITMRRDFTNCEDCRCGESTNDFYDDRIEQMEPQSRVFVPPSKKVETQQYVLLRPDGTYSIVNRADALAELLATRDLPQDSTLVYTLGEQLEMRIDLVSTGPKTREKSDTTVPGWR